MSYSSFGWLLFLALLVVNLIIVFFFRSTLWERLVLLKESEDSNALIRKIFFGLTRAGIIILAVFLLVYNGNWKAIVNPTQIQNSNELPKVLFTKLNLQLAGAVMFVVLFLGLLYVTHLAFISFDRLNIFGFGYKAREREKKQVQFADDGLVLTRRLEVARSLIIKSVSSDDFLSRVSVEPGGVLNAYDILLDFAEAIETSLSEFTKVTAGILTVTDGKFLDQQFYSIPEDLRFIIHRCQLFGKTIINDEGNILVVPLKVNEDDESYILFYIQEHHGVFRLDQVDELLVMNSWNIIKGYAQLRMVQNA